jgi:tetratricopeptide (TPR) repeat protein
MVAASAASDFDTALAHGWAAFQDASSDDDQRADMLLNLGTLSLRAGEHRAALGACLRALELTDQTRLRLPAAGTAAIAAGHLADHKTLEYLRRDIERLVIQWVDPFENARALAELAQACTLASRPEARDYAARAGVLASRFRLHEIASLLESLETAPQTRPALAMERSGRTARARDVLRTLEQFGPADPPVEAKAVVC